MGWFSKKPEPIPVSKKTAAKKAAPKRATPAKKTAAPARRAVCVHLKVQLDDQLRIVCRDCGTVVAN